MKRLSNCQALCLCLVAAGMLSPQISSSQDILVPPARGGGLITNAPMIHVDIFYDYEANEMRAILGPADPLPKLSPLPPGYAFHVASNYAILSGAAYNFQYAWNPGGTFSPPDGAAVWIELLDSSPGLETYDGPGNKMINPPRTYAPIFGTAGSSTKWQWYGRMAHNSYALRNPGTNRVWAEYRVYFGDVSTGAPDAFAGYDDAIVRLDWTVDPVLITPPARGGGIDTNPPPMIHVDIFYDYSANEMHATLDTNYGIAKLVPLPHGYAFDTRSNYSVLNGKAYNYQYAWNPGGAFSPPPGAAVWIERLSFPPGLENYDGPGNKMINPPRPWTPMLGTAGTPWIWKWYGSMAHCAFAILEPRTNLLTAEFRVYFGDATNGSREAFADFDDATVTLTWKVDPVPETPAFRFGAQEPVQGSPCQFLNGWDYATDGGRIITLRQTNIAPNVEIHACCLPLMAVPATESNGGPAPNHAAPGSHLEMEFVCLTGPAGASLALWEEGEPVPRFMVPVGEVNGANRVQLSASQPEPGCDPFGNIPGRLLTVTQPGYYALGFRVIDTSGNGPEGGPVHVPSELYWIQLQAGTTVHAWSKEVNTFTARFAGEPGVNYYLQRSPTLGPSALWQNVSPPLRGFDRLQSLRDPGASAGQGFYRLRSSVP